MVKFIIKALLKVIMFLVDIVLTPLNLLIRTLMPDFANIISIVNGFFDMLGDYAAIAVSYLGLTPLVYCFLSYIFFLSFPNKPYSTVSS